MANTSGSSCEAKTQEYVPTLHFIMCVVCPFFFCGQEEGKEKGGIALGTLQSAVCIPAKECARRCAKNIESKKKIKKTMHTLNFTVKNKHIE